MLEEEFYKNESNYGSDIIAINPDKELIKRVLANKVAEDRFGFFEKYGGDISESYALSAINEGKYVEYKIRVFGETPEENILSA